MTATARSTSAGATVFTARVSVASIRRLSLGGGGNGG
jgi:hypothetical protein